ncbi:MAG: hypothetical protein CMJ84_04955 [Planctomycetes bacterium]|nr:hypothetical protein [Planctomycetota bacterium]MDP6407996.1 lysophospholipid acyltransferase family protein [Planctomycetota bacterium]
MGTQAQQRPAAGGLRRRLKRTRKRLAQDLARRLGPAVLAVLRRTWSEEVLGAEHFAAAEEQGKGRFMALWHGRMIVALPFHAGRDYSVLVSPSSDGDVSERLLEAFGYGVIRGSTSRGGARALREMLSVLRAGKMLAITPDGPRGPRHSMNPGLVWMARATGFPVIPCGFICDRAWHASSWDSFTVPKPKARVMVVYREPVRVERDASPEDCERASELIRERIFEAERRGFEHMGLEPDW